MNFTKISSLFVLIFLTGSLTGQATNDECINAITLPVTTMCHPSFHTFEGSTTSSNGCFDDNDVWFKVTAPASGDIFITTAFPGSNDDHEIAVYTGSCNNLNEILSCQDDDDGEDNTEIADITGLTPGETVFILVEDRGDGGSFSICVADIGMDATNDECNDAIPITVSSTCSPTFHTFEGATNSGAVSDCNDNDVWFSVVVPASGDLTISTLFPGSNDDHEIAIYSGTCGALINEVSCQDDDNGPDYTEIVELTGFTPGETLFILVDDRGDGGTFSICATQLTLMEGENDECVDAYALPVGNKMCEPAFFTFEGASNSNTQDDCGENDVWFTVVVPQSGEILITTMFPGSNDDNEIAIYTGSCANPSTLISCQDDDDGPENLEVVQLEGLTPGQILYILIDDRDSGGTFSICAFDTNPVVAPIPTLSEWGLLILSLLSLVLGIVAIKSVQVRQFSIRHES
jgi:hypothetical protein